MKLTHTLSYSLTEEDIGALIHVYAIIDDLTNSVNSEDIYNAVTGEVMTLEDCKITLQSILNSANTPIGLAE